MKTFWLYNRNLAEHYLDSFSAAGHKILLPGVVFAVGIAFAEHIHLFITSFPAVLSIVIIGISYVNLNSATQRQIEPDILQSVNIIKVACKYGKFNRDILCHGINLPCENPKVFSDRGFVTHELSPIDSSDKGDIWISPNMHSGVVNDISREDINISRRVEYWVIITSRVT